MNEAVAKLIESVYEYEYLNVGMNNYIHHTAIIYPGVELGSNNIIGPYCVFGSPGHIRDAKEFKGRVIIGNNNHFGPYCSVHRSEHGDTAIGDNNMFMARVIIGHDVSVGDGCEIGNGVIISGYSVMEDSVRIKVGAIIRNRIRIGKHATVGMGSVVVKDVPWGAVVFGNPAKE